MSLRSARGVAYLLATILFVGAFALELYHRKTSTRERARFGLLRDDAELFTDALATSLRLPEACAEIFRGRVVVAGEKSALDLDYAYDPAGEKPLRAGGVAWPGTQVGRLDVSVPKYPDLRTEIGGRELRRFRARLDLEFVIKDRFPTGVPGSLEVYLWLDDRGEVRGCFGPLSVGGLCNLTGGYYDVGATDPAARCSPLVNTTIETAAARVHRGTCRITGVVSKASACPGGRDNALLFQEKVGYRTERRVLCQTCRR